MLHDGSRFWRQPLEIATGASPKLVKTAATSQGAGHSEHTVFDETSHAVGHLAGESAGQAANVCNALAKADINIRALTVLETWGDNSILRTVVTDATGRWRVWTRQG